MIHFKRNRDSVLVLDVASHRVFGDRVDARNRAGGLSPEPNLRDDAGRTVTNIDSHLDHQVGVAIIQRAIHSAGCELVLDFTVGHHKREVFD